MLSKAEAYRASVPPCPPVARFGTDRGQREAASIAAVSEAIPSQRLRTPCPLPQQPRVAARVLQKKPALVKWSPVITKARSRSSRAKQQQRCRAASDHAPRRRYAGGPRTSGRQGHLQYGSGPPDWFKPIAVPSKCSWFSAARTRRRACPSIVLRHACCGCDRVGPHCRPEPVPTECRRAIPASRTAIVVRPSASGTNWTESARCTLAASGKNCPCRDGSGTSLPRRAGSASSISTRTGLRTTASSTNAILLLRATGRPPAAGYAAYPADVSRRRRVQRVWHWDLAGSAGCRRKWGCSPACVQRRDKAVGGRSLHRGKHACPHVARAPDARV